MDTINVGIIGCGRISDLHHAGYVGCETARIHAVCDTNRTLAEQKQKAWGASKYYTDYRDLLADRDVDAVEILSPQPLHEVMVIAAAKAGKHVALQKPMTVSLTSAERILAAVKAQKILFQVSDNYLFYPPIVLAKKLIAEGAIGMPTNLRIKMISGGRGGWEVPASAWAWRAAENAQGRGFQTFDHGHHLWAVAWYLLGRVERVSSWIDTLDGIIDSPAVVMWKYRDGVKYGTCEYAHAPELQIPSKYYANDEWFEITGTKGILCIPRCTGNINPGPGLRLFDANGWRDFDDVKTDWKEGFIGATRNFIAAIQGNAAPLLCGEDAREILKLDLAISLSAKIRREVNLDELDAKESSEERTRVQLEPAQPKRQDAPTPGTGEASARDTSRDAIDVLTAGLAGRVDAEKSRGWTSTVKLFVKGDEAGVFSYELRFETGTLTVANASSDQPAQLTIKVLAAAWVDILRGAKTIEDCFISGALELDGAIEEALKLRDVLGL
ncbi:MAG: Gfo/Idh/MocA family oxidoreductase [Alphaproteobacteria bacterium]|nr:Gfo/Idh/MocA family oxidoreductase [Alphaproteobacteria bacterium]